MKLKFGKWDFEIGTPKPKFEIKTSKLKFETKISKIKFGNWNLNEKIIRWPSTPHSMLLCQIRGSSSS